MRDFILVMNFDDGSCRGIARKLRSEGIACRIVPGTLDAGEVNALAPCGIVIAGGTSGLIPMGFDETLLDGSRPVLALGDSAGLLLRHLGGTIGDQVFYSSVQPVNYTPSTLFDGVEDGERLIPCAREYTLPENVTPICYAQEYIMGYAAEGKPLFGIQLEIEPNDPESTAMLSNFAMRECLCSANWSEHSFVTDAAQEISAAAGDGNIVSMMTGGLDSGVCAVIGSRAIGERLYCLFVDTGLMRRNEVADFMDYYQNEAGLNLHLIDAQERFISALAGVTDKKEKSRIVRETFDQVLREELSKIPNVRAVICGTNGAEKLAGEEMLTGCGVPVLEPICELFKDEIRNVGSFLRLPDFIVKRQSFPDTGLAGRIQGATTPQRLRILRDADAIFRDTLTANGAHKRLSRYFAVLLPLEEADRYIICLRAVQTGDGGSIYPARLPYDVSEDAAARIMKELPEVRRVLFDLTAGKNTAEAEW